jgi:hypothetical protein
VTRAYTPKARSVRVALSCSICGAGTITNVVIDGDRPLHRCRDLSVQPFDIEAPHEA